MAIPHLFPVNNRYKDWAAARIAGYQIYRVSGTRYPVTIKTLVTDLFTSSGNEAGMVVPALLISVSFQDQPTRLRIYITVGSSIIKYKEHAASGYHINPSFHTSGKAVDVRVTACRQIKQLQQLINPLFQ